MSAPAHVLLAFDFGEKRIGVATGNTLTGAAQPLGTVAETTTDGRFARIGALIREWQPARLVVGRPLHPDGAAHEVTARAERFARQLEGRFGLPVSLVDERYSSVAAQARLRAQGRGARGRAAQGDDAMAAAIILEQYLSEAQA
ncbi:MAG: Holliday junction resolvase RuvX [Lautropia sp.]|jgi:RNAse H domain protein, YqgF family|nr:MAG: Holliday junction resolvase RuvX [Lautropia sp.]